MAATVEFGYGYQKRSATIENDTERLPYCINQSCAGVDDGAQTHSTCRFAIRISSCRSDGPVGPLSHGIPADVTGIFVRINASPAQFGASGHICAQRERKIVVLQLLVR